jgi:hypothetical protein
MSWSFGRCAGYGHVGAGRAETAQSFSPGGVHTESVSTDPMNLLCIVNATLHSVPLTPQVIVSDRRWS